MKRVVQDPEVSSAQLRSKLRMGNLLRPNGPTLLAKAKKYGVIKNFRRVPDAEMPDDDAFFDSDSNILDIKESIFCKSNMGEERSVFIIAEEIFHADRGHKGIRYRNNSGRLNEKFDSDRRRDEREARQCAAHLLAPNSAFSNRTVVTAEEIASVCGLSKQASEIRAAEINKSLRLKNRVERPLPKTVMDFLDDARTKGLLPRKKD